MRMTRRQFVFRGAGALAVLGISGPLGLFETKHIFASLDKPQVKDRTLVIVQLAGGNDGLNTIVPYSNGAYFDARPTLAVGQKEVLTINQEVGFHPALKGFKQLYDKGKLAIVQGVGYPKPDHSHFRSMDIWWTAEPNGYKNTGWLGDYLDQTSEGMNQPLRAVALGATVPKALVGQTAQVPAIQSFEAFRFQVGGKMAKSFAERDDFFKAYQNMYNVDFKDPSLALVRGKGKSTWDAVAAVEQLHKNTQLKGNYPKTQFANQLQMVARMMAGGSNTQIFYTTLGGFDDHANEKQAHERTLTDLGDSLAAFYSDLEALNLDNRVTVVCWSEFGRRVKQNASGGTDHGTAAPMFVIGGCVKGGLYGQSPSLTQLDNGDLKYTVDFRSVYATVIEQWIGGDAQSVLKQGFEQIPFFV